MDEKKLAGLTLDEKRAIIVKEDDVGLSVRQQCELLGMNRSSLYYAPVEMNEEDGRMMAEIDIEFTKTPCYGARKISNAL